MSSSTEDLGLKTLLANLKNTELLTDVSNIDYTNGEQLLSSLDIPLTAISEPFLDNVMMIKVCDEFAWKNEFPKQCGDRLQNEFNKLTSEEPHCKIFIHRDDVAIPLKEDTPRVRGVWEIAKRKGISQKFENPVVIFYKIDLADVTLDTISIKMPDILKDLEKNNFFLLDLDITRDFGGIFNKKETCEYLIGNFDFCGPDKDDKIGNCKIIRDDDFSTGSDCLTWTYSNSRVKFYNKFICQMTSPGVRNQIGNHIVNFIDCPNKRLRKTFSSEIAKKHGITRVEVTIYNYGYEGSKKNYDPIGNCSTALNDNVSYLKAAPMYSVSISKMWEKLTDKLRNSCCIVYKNTLRHVYWANSKTRKFTGVEIKLPNDPEQRKITIDHITSKFGFNNLPLNYLEILPDKKHIKKCYLNTGETFFTRTNVAFSTISPYVDIPSTGLIPTKHVVAQVLRQNTSKEITPKFEIETSSRPELSESVEVIMSEFKMVASLNSEFMKQPFAKLFFQKNCMSLKEYGKYVMYAFAIYDQGRYPLVLAVAQEDGDESKNLYLIQGKLKKKLISSYDVLIKERQHVRSISGIRIMYDAGDQPIAGFKSAGISVFNKSEYVECEDLKFYENANRNIEALKELKI